MTNIRILQVVVLTLLTVVALFFIPRKSNPDLAINSFEECVEAGYPIMESFPPMCRTPDGHSFTQVNFEEPEVIIDTPLPGETVKSPMLVKGRAKGFWYFEANLPVTLKDQNGNILAQKGFQAKGEWMTEEYVEFEDTLTFPAPTTPYGVLLIEKDNPSGLPEHDAAYAVPLIFAQ